MPSSDGDSLTAFTDTGNEVWSFHPGAYVYSSPAVWAGRVYVGSYNGVFYCLSADTGRVLWEVGMGGAVSGAPTVVDGVAYAASFADNIVGADARTQRPRPVPVPARPVRPGLGQRRPAAAARLRAVRVEAVLRGGCRALVSGAAILAMR